MDPYRLPRNVIPRRYDLTLCPDLEAGTFTGAVDVGIDVREPTLDVWLNAAELTISAARWRAAGSEEAAAVTLDEPAERCRLAFASPRPVGPAVLSLSFTG